MCCVRHSRRVCIHDCLFLVDGVVVVVVVHSASLANYYSAWLMRSGTYTLGPIITGLGPFCLIDYCHRRRISSTSLENNPMACFLSSALQQARLHWRPIESRSMFRAQTNDLQASRPHQTYPKKRRAIASDNIIATRSLRSRIRWLCYRRFSCASTETLSSNAKKLEVTKHPCLIRKR